MTVSPILPSVLLIALILSVPGIHSASVYYWTRPNSGVSKESAMVRKSFLAFILN